MTDDFEYSDTIGEMPTHMRNAEVFGPLQRTWSNVNRGFSEDVQISIVIRSDARLTDSRSRPMSKGMPKEDVEEV